MCTNKDLQDINLINLLFILYSDFEIWSTRGAAGSLSPLEHLTTSLPRRAFPGLLNNTDNNSLPSTMQSHLAAQEIQYYYNQAFMKLQI